MAQIPDVSVILPIRNAASTIASLLLELMAFSALHPEYEFLFASDGSTDGTQDIFADVIRQHGASPIKIIHYDRHQGKGGAVRDTFVQCCGNYVIFTDGDLAYDLNFLLVLRETLNHCDMAIASRRKGGDATLGILTMRGFVSFVYNRYTAFVLALTQTDIQAGLKGFRRKAADRLFTAQKITGFAFDAELLFLAKKYGFSVCEFPAQVRPEHHGAGSVWRIGLRSAIMFFQVLRVRYYDLAGYY